MALIVVTGNVAVVAKPSDSLAKPRLSFLLESIPVCDNSPDSKRLTISSFYRLNVRVFDEIRQYDTPDKGLMRTKRGRSPPFASQWKITVAIKNPSASSGFSSLLMPAPARTHSVASSFLASNFSGIALRRKGGCNYPP
jgi:hypothetical protein